VPVVGISFGLPKIVANFISGIILLADKSVKPGDLVTIGDSSGRISAMKTRYISVAAGDGREFLIPERGSGDAEGRQLDLHRQEYAGEGQFRHQLRRRSAAGLQAGDRGRGDRAAPPSNPKRRTASWSNSRRSG